MKPTPARQRREAHRTRKALGRALHSLCVNKAAYLWATRGRRAASLSISKGPLRKHRQSLLWTLLRA